MRRFVWIAGISIVLLGALITAGLMSSTGLRAMISLVSGLPAISIQVERVNGRLVDAWQLEAITLEIPAALISIDRMSVDWRPAELFRRKLHIADISLQGLSVALRSGNAELPSAEAESPLALPPLPLSLLIGRLLIENAVILSEAEGELLLVDQFHASASSNEDTLSIGQVLLRTPHYGFNLQGQLQLAGESALTAEGSWWGDFQQFNKMTGELHVEGTLAQIKVALSMTTPAELGISGRIDNLLSEAAWDLVGSGEAIELRTISPSWPEAKVDLNLSTSGRPAAYSGSVRAQYAAAAQLPAQVEIDISGDRGKAEVVSAVLSYNGSIAHLHGTVDFQDTLAWDASATVDALDLSTISGKTGLKIGADLHSTGTWSNEALTYDVKVATLTGQLSNPDIMLTGDLQVQGNAEGLDLKAAQLKLGDGLLQVRGRLGWVDKMSWQADLELHEIDPALLGDLPGGRINGTLTSEGLLSADDLSFTAVVTSLSGELSGRELHGGGSAAFRQNSLEVTDVHLQSGDNSMQLNGYVADNYALQLIIEGTDLGSLYPLLEGQLQLSGSLTGPRTEPVAQLDVSLKDFSYDSHHVPELTGAFQARLTKDLLEAEIISAGIDSADSTATISGKIGWRQGFAWSNLLEVRSLKARSFDFPVEAVVNLEVNSSGQWSTDNLQYSVDITKVSATLPASVSLHGSAELEGDEKRLTLTRADLQAEDGLIKLTGHLDWSADLSWETRLKAEGIDPHLFGSLPEGNIYAEVSSSGHISAGEQRIIATIHQLSGTLAGYELEGGGSIGMINNALATDGLYIQNGGNRLQVEGVAGASYGLDFIFKGTDLNRLHQSVDGTIEISGKLSGTREEPVAQIDIIAQDLGYQDHHIADLSGDAQLMLGSNQSLQAALQLKGFKSASFVLDQLDMQVKGSLEQHQIALDGLSPYGDFSIGASGQMRDSGWQGVIDYLKHEHQKFGSWQQRVPSTVAISADLFQVDSFCLDSAENSICVEGEWRPAGPWRLELSELRFDLADLYHWGVLATPTGGELDGYLSSAGFGMIVESMTGKLNIPELSIDLKEAVPYQDIRWLDTSLAVNLHQSILETTISSRFVDTSTIDGNIIIEGFGDLSEPLSGLPLRGHVVLDIKDLSPLQTITGDYLMPTGHVMADLVIDGMLGKPELTGNLELQEGGIQFPQLGSSLTDMTGSISLQGNELAVRLDGACGTGAAQGSGTLSFGDGDWQGRFQINGSDCQVMDIPELAMSASPELELVLGSEGGRLTGSLLIPRALIKPEMMKGAKFESADVVFVDEQGSSGSRWIFNYQIAIELGDDITVEGYGLDAHLAGGLVLSNKNRMITGRGVLEVARGSFTIYGRPLEIQRGKISFTGGPVDNPVLDVSASKVIETTQFGQRTVVGVNVIGTVSDYEIELFSIPLMEDREIIAYILFDKSFASSDESSRGIADKALRSFGLSRGSAILGSMTEILPVDEIHFEGGVNNDASLVVGRSLTEQLSVNYDFNLINNAGTIKVRYEFGKGFSVQSRSSFDTNGLELLYSFER